MNKFFISIFLMFFTSVSAWCGYAELKSDLDTYAAPYGRDMRSGSFETPLDIKEKGEKSHRLKSGPDTTKKVKTETTEGIMDGYRGRRGFSNNQERLLTRLSTINEHEKTVLQRKVDTGITDEANDFYRIPPHLTALVARAQIDDRTASALLKKNISPDLLSALVMVRNPAIDGARARVQAEQSSYGQVADLNQVLTRYSAFTEGLINGVGPMRGRQAIGKDFPFPGVTALKGQVVNQSVAAAREALYMAQREAVTGVQKAFWNRVYLARARQVTRETLALFTRLHQVARTLYGSGKTGFQDVARVEVRMHLLRETLDTLLTKQRNADAVILSLVNLSPETILGPAVDTSLVLRRPGLSTLYAAAAAHRQELKRLRAVIGKMERLVEMAETMILPSMSLGFSEFKDAAVMQVGSQAMVPAFPEIRPAATGKGLPVKPWYGTGASWIMEIRKKVEWKKAQLVQMEADTRQMVFKAWGELDRALRNRDIYDGTVVELTATALKVSTREYEAGRLAFTDVVGAYTEWLQSRLALARAESDVGIARAEIARITGKGDIK